MNRRSVLATTASLIGWFAGCTSDPMPSSVHDPTTTNPQSPTTGPQPSADFIVESRGCGSQHETAEVDSRSNELVITGIVGGRDTCDTAVLANVDLVDNVLTVGIETVRESTEMMACAQCLTDIEYTATIHLAGAEVNQVVVEHDGETIVTESV